MTFHQTFDDAAALLQPAMGPSGQLPASVTPTFAPGVSGNAYYVTKATSGALVYPGSIVPADRGTIEVLARVSVLSDTVPWGDAPYFFFGVNNATCNRCIPGCDLVQKPVCQTYLMGFNGNDGCGGGGLVAAAGNRLASSNNYAEKTRYADLLGATGTQTWHRYTLTWDAAGLWGTGTHVQMYVDGAPVGCEECHFSLPYQELSFAQPATLMLGYIQVDGYAVALDELKIWNYAVAPNVTGMPVGRVPPGCDCQVAWRAWASPKPSNGRPCNGRLLAGWHCMGALAGRDRVWEWVAWG